MKLFDVLKQKWISQYNRDIPSAVITDSEMPSGDDVPQSPENERIRRVAALTPREKDIFMLLLEGYTLKESANRLSVKYSTANTHMTGIYKKLNVKSRAELIIRYRDAAAKFG